jgi:hypothetical protein
MTEQSNTKKLKAIKGLISQHRNSLSHKPYYDKKDQARVEALMNDIMEVLWTVDYKKSNPTSSLSSRTYWEDKEKNERKVVDPEIQKEINRQGLKAVRGSKRGN